MKEYEITYFKSVKRRFLIGLTLTVISISSVYVVALIASKLLP